jgi:hypothetical protein
MAEALRIGGWAQGIYETSSTKKYRYGTYRVTEDGRTFRYCRSAEALVAGKIAQGSEVAANHFNETGDTVAKGSKVISLVVGNTAVTAGLFADGFFQVYDGAAGTVGLQYRIKDHNTCAGTGTCIVVLDDAIRVALISTDSWSLIPSLWGGTGVTHNASVAKAPAGYPLVAFSAADIYGWLQTGGPCIRLDQASVALGSVLVTSATEGATKVQAAFDSAILGFTYSITGVTTKYCPGYLTIR